MAFLEELGKTITDKSKEAAKRAKEIAETIQLKSQIGTEKNMIQEMYTVIGKQFYEKHPTAPEEQYQELFSKIDNALAKISLLEDEICEMEGTRVCAECGYKVDKEAVFCSRCGVKMAVPEPAPVEDEAEVKKEAEEMAEEVESVNEEQDIQETADEPAKDPIEVVVDETEEDI